MTPQTAWLLAISAVIVAALIGFFVGRRFGAGKARIDELEAELGRQQDEVDRYRAEVAAHFDQTATLFVSMADSYRALSEHLSAGYEKLSSAPSHAPFPQRIEALQVVGEGSASEPDGRPGADERREGAAASRAAAAAAGAATIAAGAAMGGGIGAEGEDGGYEEDGEGDEGGEREEGGAAPARTVAGDAGIDEERREEDAAGVALDPIAEEVSGERAGRGEEAK
ncbi:YhcB family protein [Thauera aromatica]|uniref:Z-ring associated protein G n=1 Tax=Thauera aromatica K172 TaxID=44139 RepID=A0A2R4BS29_THAAR|nr:DUF1043 family protein [Thauera aromatica]AVR90004.1 hypothetical protein Tharo_3123 [Thauera aromatica K172]